MSVTECSDRTIIQPWMGYRDKERRRFPFYDYGYPYVVTQKTGFLPFQIISIGPYEKTEISEFKSDVWSEITVPVTTVIIDGLYYISYDGSALPAELTCGDWEVKITAGEVWWMQIIVVDDFVITTNSYPKDDSMFMALKFSEQEIEGLPLIAGRDHYLPFQYRTSNASTDPAVWLEEDTGGLTELTTFPLTVTTIGGYTYYIHFGECFYPFLDCGIYRLKIIDGAFTYYSVWFRAETLDDIPLGYRANRDANGCIIRDEDGDITYSICYE